MTKILDLFDRQLLNLIQRDGSATADMLATEVALSPSAIARRIRRHRRDGLISRTIALLSPKFRENRIRAVATVQFANHADRKAIRALEARLNHAPMVQCAYTLAGSIDLILMIDCANMQEFAGAFHDLLANDPAVLRFETYLIKNEVKFAPFVDLVAGVRDVRPETVKTKGAADLSATP